MEKFENVSFAIYPVIYRSMYCTEEEKEAFDAFISSLKNRKGQKVFYEGENKN
jgi:hypothetical protein